LGYPSQAGLTASTEKGFIFQKFKKDKAQNTLPKTISFSIF